MFGWAFCVSLLAYSFGKGWLTSVCSCRESRTLGTRWHQSFARLTVHVRAHACVQGCSRHQGFRLACLGRLLFLRAYDSFFSPPPFSFYHNWSKLDTVYVRWLLNVIHVRSMLSQVAPRCFVCIQIPCIRKHSSIEESDLSKLSKKVGSDPYRPVFHFPSKVLHMAIELSLAFV